MTTWLDVATHFARTRDLDEEVIAVLRCFAGPEPRGGPPPPPEEPWDDSFEALERELLAVDLAAIAGRLMGEVDHGQAELFARRVQSVDAAIAALHDDVGRLLRVGLRHRLRTVTRGRTARATRTRALADFYYSVAGLHRSRRLGGEHLVMEQHVSRLRWRRVSDGVEHAQLEGRSDLGPLHVNLLRIEPEHVHLRVLDCRESVERGEPFHALVSAHGAIAGVSGGFFLYSEPDIAPPSRRFDPVGLLMDEGEVLGPPVFARGAVLVHDDGTVAIDRVSMSQVEIEAPSGARWRPSAVVNRAHARRGPDRPGAAVVGHEVVAVGRSLPVPLNGFVLEPPPGVELRPGDRLRYPVVHGPAGRPLRTGIAGGPLLLQDGEPTLDMRAEDLWGSAPPVTFSQDETGDHNLLPRLAAGLTDEGQLLLAAVDGRNLEHALGMTLGGVARLLRALGCHRATNLDGGSSKRMVVEGRTCDLATTEIVAEGVASTLVRPVHTGLLVLPR
ncbi:MAG: phosphodiester glycosidase family protein [Myxococcales bacterium]|nr:phosphodiester glycosidase family protein [Myxococcales bacterium]MCB9714750.1 phosphodiester glycosidase family protein [Myxococcales bacterium]